MAKLFFNIIIISAAAFTLLLIVLERIERTKGNAIFAILFSIFIIYFGYTENRKDQKNYAISLFYIMFGIIILLMNALSLWRMI